MGELPGAENSSWETRPRKKRSRQPHEKKTGENGRQDGLHGGVVTWVSFVEKSVRD